ncbi:peroxidase family protein [Salinibacter ruber]|uniref:Peroxidase n=2 Tax=Salinibacteraceae TaxID=1853225 RepID=A0A9X2UP24_9BACT|nr:heme peroxidase family protein [Salinibacter ruber]MCS3665358.1 hypothetical protein [Salinibacter ruber]MCS4038130.1 hypothetical protein [Salinibacter ruber]MCS4122657.1 hypothetical protein [Salinibacter ruber]MCS4159583.1 hypothetical protein [Salinibacter ruber]
MANHHGMNDLEGIDAFCHYGHEAEDEDRFGRLFGGLPPLNTRSKELEALGAQDGPMDGGEDFDRTDTVSAGQIFFGQFIDHDITLDTTTSLASVADESEVPNVRTPTLDLDNIYGMGPEASPFLYRSGRDRDFAEIKLLTAEDGTAAEQDEDLREHDLQRSPDGTAVIGDPRNDENRVISQLQLAMIRFHNATVDYLYENGLEGEELEGAELFEEARRLVRWHYQYVIVENYLPKICGKAVVDRIKGQGREFYCPRGGEPYIPIEFSVAAYRFGHSMMPERIQVQTSGTAYELFGRTFGIGFRPLGDENAVVDWHELTETDEDRHVQNAEELDTKLATDLLDLRFIREGESSLATRNLLRGQTFLLPSGEEVARRMGRPDSEIDRVADEARDMAEPAADLSGGIPLWFYILTEAEELGREDAPGEFEDGEGLGPVGAQIVAETLYGLIELDDRSYLSTNRNWDPEDDGVGPRTLGQMLTYGQPDTIP